MSNSNSTTALPETALPSKITLSESFASSSRTQPQTTPITNLASTPNPVSTGSLLALNSSYIVYAVKGGLIRVMDRSSSNPLRTLLRSHTERITDCAFFGFDASGKGGGSDVLASVGGDSVVIWRILSNVDELASEILLEIGWSDNTLVCNRVVWHPSNPNQFMLILGGDRKDRKTAMFVETTKLFTVSKNGHAFCGVDYISKNSKNSTVDGMLDLIVLDGEEGESTEIMDLSWSTVDSRHVLTAHRDGYIRLWDIKDTIYIRDGNEVTNLEANSSNNYVLSARCITSVKVSSSSAIQKCFFLNSFEDAYAFMQQPGSIDSHLNRMTSPLCTVTEDGEVGLWSPFTENGGQSNIVQLVTLDKVMSSPVHAALCSLPHGKTEEDPPSAFIILADALGNISALHLASEWRLSERKMAVVKGFNFISLFKTLQPIYSWNVMYSIDDSSDTKQYNIDCYCVQSKAVQKLTLSPSMCSAPSPLPQGYVPDGVTLVDVKSILLSEEKSYGDEDKIEFDDYEDVSDVEEEEEAQPISLEPKLDKQASTTHPVPTLPSFLTGNSNPSSFSNWLGNLVTSTKDTTPKSTVPPTPTVTPVATPLTAKPQILDLEKFPLPNIPESTSSTSLRAIATGLLSPTDMIGSKLAEPETTDVATKVSKEKKTTKPEKKAGSRPKSNTPEPGVVAILKREDPSIVSEVDPASIGTIGQATKQELEEIVRKAVMQHLQKQETMIVSEIQKAVRYEVQSGLVPTLNKTVSKTLEETISKSIKSQMTSSVKEYMTMNTSEITSAIASSLQQPILDSFLATMREVIVPAYESGTRQMMEQISSSIETSLDLNQKSDDSTTKMMESMVSRMDAMGKTIEVLLKAVATLAAKQNAGTIIDTSGSHKSDNTELKRIELLIKNKDFEAAFTQALSASKPELAVYACKLSDLATVIEGDSPLLSQPILLCLMQQLGADLSLNNDLNIKISWLQSVAVTLDPNHESIKKHVKGVCQQLVSNLQTKMAESDAGVRRQLQMLTQVIRGVGS